jgi:SAM-dependent methyltransferase
MTIDAAGRRANPPPAPLFAVTVFTSAALVFLVQPMIAKLVLPLLGGSPSVWNTSLAFFQIALLAGYGYAHLLQRLPSLKAQALCHCAALLLAAAALPLRVNTLFGPPSSEHPILWLLGVLAVSLGAPFAVLSATAPLVQAWYARTRGGEGGRDPYVLYVASNMGSLLALLAYPVVVEPLMTLGGQRWGWSAGYLLFVLIIGALALLAARSPDLRGPSSRIAGAKTPVTWRERLIWIGLAAIPSSLMLGVTTYITTDIASAPFLWVLPLALYLVTFIIAFQSRPLIPLKATLLAHAVLVAECAAMMPFVQFPLLLQVGVNIGAFFVTALLCHQMLAARRPDPSRLTEFYLCMSVGGVVGGGFNAFLAPVLFTGVWEYPLILVLACLARPWNLGRIPARAWVLLAVGLVAAFTAPVVMTFRFRLGAPGDDSVAQAVLVALITTAVICAVLVRRWGLLFFALAAVTAAGAHAAAQRATVKASWRSFFGVIRQTEAYASNMSGVVRMLSHGTTLHGAQAQNPAWRCRPLVYYTPSTPIGQVFTGMQMDRPALRIGAVGLGAGSVAAYVRPADHLTFFEIDPAVVEIATDPARFTYTSECAKGRIDYVVGDARLTLAHQPPAGFDVLLIDAFSSDAVPAHLLTVEAIKGYLTRLKPDGVLVLHLSNRHLDLDAPAQAVARAAGAASLMQAYRPAGQGAGWESPEDALIIARSPQALARFAADRRWDAPAAPPVRPWTDDYTNLPGALWRKMRERWAGE